MVEVPLMKAGRQKESEITVSELAQFSIKVTNEISRSNGRVQLPADFAVRPNLT